MRFSEFGKRVVFAAFDGGEITTDAGVLLLREQARRIGLFERMAACFTDRRDPARAVHALPALLAQRVAGIALGYEDINDHDALRHDPACKLLADCGGGPAPAGGKAPPALAGKSTLNRIEHAWDTGDRRYHQISANLKQLSNLFVSLFLDAPPHAARAHHPRYRRHRRGWKPTGARRTPSSTAITNTAASCRSMSSAGAISCSPSSGPPTSMAPGVRATRSAASSG